MTDIVEPSINSTAEPYILAGAIKNASATDGWVQESATSLYAAHTANMGNVPTLSGTPLNAFNHASTSGHDVTIDTGEGFVGGAWLARDTQTVVSLAASTSDQTVYLGWDESASDTVIIGLSGDFGSADRKIPIWEFDTDGSTVTSSTDKREVGRTTDLGQINTSAGAEFARYLMTAVASTPVGTGGNSGGELARAPGSTSDLVFSGEHGDGRVAITYNAYYDGAWKYIVGGGVDAYRLSYDGGSIELEVADGTGKSADDVISWKRLAWDENGTLVADGTTVYDGTNVPQSVQGGPAGSLSAHPLATSDLDGSGGSSGQVLQTDGTQGGVSWADSSGGWQTLATMTDSDNTSPLLYDTDDNSDLSTTYDRYRLTIFRESTKTDENYQNIRINSDGSSNYKWDRYVADSNDHSSRDGTSWGDIAGVAPDAAGGSDAQVSCQVVEITHPAAVGSISNRYPVMSVPTWGVPKNVTVPIQGSFTKSVSAITRIELFGGEWSTGKVLLEGKDLF